MLSQGPLDGLLNRLRAVASFYTARAEAGRDLTVVRLRDEGMECPAARLFQLPDGI